MLKEILDFLKMHDVKFKENTKLRDISPVKIGGVAEILAYPDSEEKLVAIVDFFNKCKIKHKILGRMSNVLPPDEKYEGVIIRTDLLKGAFLSGERLIASCGASLPLLSSLACDCGLGGLEGLSGIPGSLGGAIVGNAGAFGDEIADRINKIRVLDHSSNEIYFMSASDAKFGYRSSCFKGCSLVILSAELILTPSDSRSVREKMNACRSRRLNSQPTEPSLGSTFKRPSDELYAARLIDECGLKGFFIGDAEISKKHAGFIINKGFATASDYIALADYTAKVVYDKFAVSLDREIEIIS